MHRTASADPAQELLVQPRYLAGPGDPARVVDALSRTPGWSEISAPAGSRHFASPCHRVRVVHDSQGSDTGGWRFTTCATPLGATRWIATFTGHTPVEIVAAMAQALLHTLETGPEGVLLGGPQFTTDTPTSVLEARGWKPDPFVDACHLSPDPHSHTYVRANPYATDPVQEIEGFAPAAWTIFSSTQHLGGPRWYADFTAGIPLHLVTAAVDALSDPAPVRRRPDELPEAARSHLATRPVLLGTASQRAGAARARSIQAGHGTAMPATTAAASTTPPPRPRR